jgi:hypothetical protein
MRPRQLAAALLLPALAACAGGKARAGRGGSGQTATLEVRNSYLGPVAVYAVRQGGTVRRIGSAYSSKVERITLGPDLIGTGSSVLIFAVPVAENARASTGQITVRPGDVVQFNIAQDLRASSVFIR